MRKPINLLLLLLIPMMGMAATHDYVDLGLPSATMWATCNVGANAPEEYGSYFAWGETAPKTSYSWKNYKFCKGTSASVYDDPSDEQDWFLGWGFSSYPSYDAANKNWGGSWKTPTIYQIKELLCFCTATTVTQNGVKGVKFTGPNGKSIFMPLAGYKYDSKYLGTGSETYFWSANRDKDNKAKAQTLYLGGSEPQADKLCWRRTGLPIRPVMMQELAYVDLGLSKQWATCNIGATSPEQQGRLYAWSEYFPKDKYTWANYVGGQYDDQLDYNFFADPSSIVGKLFSDVDFWGEDELIDAINDYYWYDAYSGECLTNATPPGSGSYHEEMPDEGDFEELIIKCKWKETTLSGVKGYQVTGPNGNSIFLPYGGCSYDGKVVGKGTNGYYWSSDIDISNDQKARALYIKSGTKEVKSAQLRTGIMIRPVRYYSSGIEPQPIPELSLVDLGLSVKWADTNLDYDGYSHHSSYYAWGELTPDKDTYTWGNYMYADGSASTCWDLECDIISQDPNYDAAAITYYDEENEIPYDLCMPTEEQWEELFQNCTFKIETDDWQGKGYRVTGPNGNSIFLPFSGCSYDGKDYGEDEYAYYWTGNADPGTVSKARAAYIKSGTRKMVSIQRRTGVAIRPVSVEWAIPPGPDVPGSVAFEPVDLGLSVYWCSENVGVQMPGSSDIYTSWFAWGETDTKDYGGETDYTWASYEYANGTSSSVIDIGSDISASNYDAAWVLKEWMLDTYDSFYEWRMPTGSEIQELITKCTWKECDGGYVVTGPNGNSIFLPFSGCSYDGKRFDDVPYAYFWSSNVDKSNKSKAKALYIKTGVKPTLTSIQRRTGCAIRPVVDNIQWADLGLSSDNYWARNNIKASMPEASGGFWAWCEKKEKSDYTWNNYKATADSYDWWTGETKGDLNTTLSYRVPFASDFEELINECNLEERTFDGVKGVQFIGPNGNSIFLPYAGSKYDGKGPQNGTLSYYWSQDSPYKEPKKAFALSINNGLAELTKCQLRTGLPIRLVAGSIIYAYSSYTDDINDMNVINNIEEGAIYTLQGIKVEGVLKPGIYIHSGKKIIVK